MQTQFPMPKGTALRWSAQQAIHLQLEGYGEAVISSVRPILTEFALSGDYRHMAMAQRLLKGDR